MTLRLQKLILILLLGGDLGHSPTFLEACLLPHAPPQCDQANILFAPVSICLLNYQHPYSATATVLAALVTILVGLMLPMLSCALAKLGGQIKSILEYIQVNSQHWIISIVCASSLTLRLVYFT